MVLRAPFSTLAAQNASSVFYYICILEWIIIFLSLNSLPHLPLYTTMNNIQDNKVASTEKNQAEKDDNKY